MNGVKDDTECESIALHNFSEKILEQVVHFHVMKMSGGFFLWVGSTPELSNLAVSMCSKYVSKCKFSWILQQTCALSKPRTTFVPLPPWNTIFLWQQMILYVVSFLCCYVLSCYSFIYQSSHDKNLCTLTTLVHPLCNCTKFIGNLILTNDWKYCLI